MKDFNNSKKLQYLVSKLLAIELFSFIK